MNNDYQPYLNQIQDGQLLVNSIFAQELFDVTFELTTATQLKRLWVELPLASG